MIIHPTLIFKNKSYYFNRLYGILKVHKCDTKDKYEIENSIKKKNLEVVLDPYKIKVKDFEITVPPLNKWIRQYALMLVWLCRNCYIIAILFSKVRFNIFDNSQIANEVFYEILGRSNQHELCLPRAIFICSTSKLFSEKGSLFIGIFLPTHNMHAWVMEDGTPADCHDDIWIDFLPILIDE